MINDINITLILDYIGFYGRLILIFISIFILQNKIIYLHVFIVGLILNNILNVILKYSIKDPRPSKDSRIIEIAVANGKRFGPDEYGMPSGHIQNCGYCLSFITLVCKNAFITGLYLVITFLAMYQRYKYFNHTILQIIVGFIIGLSFGYLVYFVGNKTLKGNLTMKFDDYAPK
jgi:membrane-associated phospholipid phosphatase